MTGTDQSGKSSSAVPHKASPRDKAWSAEFERQATAAMRRSALKAARRCVQMIHWSGGQVGSSYAEDLVDDAIADTWRGVLTWKPTPERTLLRHIIAAVESRARHAREKAENFPTASLDAHEDGEDDARGAALWAEAAAKNPATMASNMILAIEVYDRLRMLAIGDLEILALLDAMRMGAVDRADLLHATGMSARRYESARRRLDTLLLELPKSMTRGIAAARASTGELHAA